MIRILRNPRMKWAIEPGHQGSLLHIDGIAGTQTRVPEIGEVLTLPFLVDPDTRLPMPVRVTRIEYQELPTHTLVIPVIVRATSD